MREWRIKYYDLNQKRQEIKGPTLGTAAAMVAISPDYQYIFSGGHPTLSLRFSEKTHQEGLSKQGKKYRPTVIAGSVLGALSNIPPSTRLHILSGYGATGPHFSIAHALQSTEAKQQSLMTFDEVLQKGRQDAAKAEQDFITREQRNISKACKTHKFSKIHHTSDIEKNPQFQEIRARITQYYKKNRAYKSKVQQFAEEALNRIFSHFLQNEAKNWYCRVKKKNGENFKIPELLNELMVIHALDEMAHAVFLAPQHGIHYLLHIGASGRESRVDQNIRELLQLSMQEFTGSKGKPSHQIGWVRFGFEPAAKRPTRISASHDDGLDSSFSEECNSDSTVSDESLPETPPSPSDDPVSEKVNFIAAILLREMILTPERFPKKERVKFCSTIVPCMKFETLTQGTNTQLQQTQSSNRYSQQVIKTPAQSTTPVIPSSTNAPR